MLRPARQPTHKSNNNIMTIVTGPSRRHRTIPNNSPSPLLSLLISASLLLNKNIGSASFLAPSSPIRAYASAMSADSGSTGCASSIPPRAGKGVAADGVSHGSSQNDDEDAERVLQLPEATNDPSIKTIKLGGTRNE
jgi:hypothetical protein